MITLSYEEWNAVVSLAIRAPRSPAEDLCLKLITDSVRDQVRLSQPPLPEGPRPFTEASSSNGVSHELTPSPRDPADGVRSISRFDQPGVPPGWSEGPNLTQPD